MRCTQGIVWIFLLSILCSACQHHPSKPPSTVRINIGQEPASLDPRKARSLNDLNIAHMLFEGLTRLSRSGTIELALAESFECSEDGKHYLFHLKSSVWSDGKAVTADDFANSWRTLLDPKFPSSMAYQLYGIQGAKAFRMQESTEWGVQVIDAKTLSIQLEHPLPYFLELLSMPCFYPFRADCTEQNWLGNGPFVLTRWSHGNQLCLTKNPLYWEASTVQIQSLELLMVSMETEQALFAQAELDWAGSPFSRLSSDALHTVKTWPSFHTASALGTFFFRVNTISQQQPLLSNPQWRQWISGGIDRQALVEHILQGGQLPAYGFLPPPFSHRNTPFTLSPAQEKPHMPLVLTYANSEATHLIAQALQEQWAQNLQLHVTLEAVEPRLLYQKLSTGAYDLALGSWFADFQDPINFLEVFQYKEGSTNNTGWENRQYIDLLTQSLVCLESRETLLRQAEQLLMEELPMIPLYHGSFAYLQNRKLHDVILSPLGQIDFRWAYFE